VGSIHDERPLRDFHEVPTMLVHCPPAKSGIDFSRLYRAHIGSADWRRPERTAFVEAFSHNCACKKIVAAVAALEHRQPAEVADRIYNCYSAKELVDEGLSEEIELRLFETGWSGGKATHFVSEPLFLLERPRALIAVWTEIARMQAASAPADVWAAFKGART
jgi:hypothetical protein